MKDFNPPLRNRKRLSDAANLVIGSILFVLLLVLVAIALAVFIMRGELG